MLKSGHTREAVLEYELPYMFGFVKKMADWNKKISSKIKPDEKGWTQVTDSRRVKVVTSEQMLQKLRMQQGRRGS